MSTVGFSVIVSASGPFLELALGRLRGRVVRHGRDGDEHVGGVDAREHGLRHVGRAAHVDARRRRSASASGVGPATSVTCAPASAAACANAKPILPELELVMPRTGSIASNVGPAVTSTLLAGEQLRLPQRDERRVQLRGLEHAAVAGLVARELAAAGAEDGHAVRAQPRHVALRGRVAPHLHVHRRGDEQRAFAREAQRGEQVVGVAVARAWRGNPRTRARRGWRRRRATARCGPSRCRCRRPTGRSARAARTAPGRSSA